MNETAKATESIEEMIDRLGIRLINDEAELAPVVERVMRENPKAVADYRAGRKQAVGRLVGEVMRATNGNANAEVARRMLGGRLEPPFIHNS